MEYRQRVRQPIVSSSLLHPDIIGDAWLVAAVESVEAAARAGGPADRVIVPPTTVVADAGRQKQCRYRVVADDGGTWCEAPHVDSGEPERIDPADCWRCNVPDDRVACQHWRGALLRTSTLPDGAVAREAVASECAAGQRASECIPGGSPCWFRRIDVRGESSDRRRPDR